MEKEIWKDIKGYEGIYKISSLGRIINVKKDTFKEPNIGSHGYLKINLYNKGVEKTRTIHSLLAEHFLNHNPNGHKIVVDHIDNNPLNNDLKNLQLITNRENTAKEKRGKSDFTGVHFDFSSNKWMSRIFINGKRKYLGLFETEYQAHLAYQKELESLSK